jgi:tripartite-type tricarboxylate transporter receptor subunit TctC
MEHPPRALVVLAAILLLGGGAAVAQPYPSKPIRVIVAFTPGGVNDIIARVVGQKLGDSLGARVIVDHRPGAAGGIGMGLAAKAAADGYTLAVGNIGVLAVNPHLYSKLPYDALADFAPITLVATVPNMLAVHPSLPVRSVKELIGFGRARPGELNYASTGPGGTPFLAMELFKVMAKLNIVSVAYKGSAPMLIGLIGGESSLTMIGIPVLLPHVKAGKLRALAVGTPQRVSLLPELPTIAEAGLPGYEATSWYGIVAPATTPQEIVSKLNAEIVKGIASPDAAGRLAAEGAQPSTNTPEQFRELIKSEYLRWGKVMKATGISAE